MRHFLIAAVAAAALAAPAQAPAQDTAADTLAEVQALIESGELGTDDLPAVRIAAEGCDLTIAFESFSDQLGTVLHVFARSDARDLTYADPQVGAGAAGARALLPSSKGVVAMNMRIDTEDAAIREAFGTAMRVPCTEAGPCQRQAPSNGFPVVAAGDNDAERLVLAVGVLERFSKVCDAG